MNSIIDPHTGLLISSYFQKRIYEEEARTHRTNSPFSLIFIDLDLNHMTGEIHKEKVYRVLADSVFKNSRETDLKGWFNDHIMAVLLPETPYSGAEVLCTKLINASKAALPDCSENGFRLEDCFTITSYPRILYGDENANSRLVAKTKGLDPAPILSKGIRSELRHNAGKRSNKKHKLQLPLFPHEFKGLYSGKIPRALKRLVDIVGSLIAIVFFLPSMLIIAALIKLTSPGPILYRQTRMGFLGRDFTFLKFRSMYMGCDENSHKEYVTNLIKDDHHKAETLLYKMESDPRVTPLGRFLRMSSLDELPQLFNVLKGEMSLVGPRPPIPYEVEEYENWHLRRILEVKPGITGLWQVTGRSTTTFNQMVRLDISYVSNWSLWLDFKILLRTIWAVLSARGAY